MAKLTAKQQETLNKMKNWLESHEGWTEENFYNDYKNNLTEEASRFWAKIDSKCVKNHEYCGMINNTNTLRALERKGYIQIVMLNGTGNFENGYLFPDIVKIL